MKTAPLLLPLVLIFSACTKDIPLETHSGMNTSEPQSALLPGVVFDAKRQSLYINREDGSLAAIDLASGTVRDRGGKLEPLMALGDRLLAMGPAAGQAHAFRLSWLALDQDAAVVQESEPVVLPDWATVAAARGRSFSAQATVEGGQPVLRWEAASFYAGGARPTQAVVAQSHKKAAGMIRLDAQNGQITELSPLEGADEESAPTASGEGRNIESAPYWTGRAWHQEPIRVDDRWVAFELRQEASLQVFGLATWDAAHGPEASKRLELARGRSIRPILSSNNRRLLVCDGAAEESAVSSWPVYALPEGTLAGRLPRQKGTVMAVAFIGPRALLLTEDRRPLPGEPGQILFRRFLSSTEFEGANSAWAVPIKPRVGWRPAR